jgi:hypothetical protein
MKKTTGIAFSILLLGVALVGAESCKTSQVLEGVETTEPETTAPAPETKAPAPETQAPAPETTGSPSPKATDRGGEDIPRTKESCEARGGTWYPHYGETIDVCVMPFKDGGKKCTSSDECEGNCVTNVVSQLGKQGTCQKTTDSSGCENAVESQYFDCRLDDVMVRCAGPGVKPDPMCEKLKGDLYSE